VGLIAGDDVLAAEMADWFPWAERIVVKEAFGRHSAASVHPTVARDRIRAGAERAVRRAIEGELQPLVLEPPYAVEITYQNALQADYASLVPGAERVGETGSRFIADDPLVAYRGFLAGVPGRSERLTRPSAGVDAAGSGTPADDQATGPTASGSRPKSGSGSTTLTQAAAGPVRRSRSRCRAAGSRRTGSAGSRAPRGTAAPSMIPSICAPKRTRFIAAATMSPQRSGLAS
jgi:hypothetical protein